MSREPGRDSADLIEAALRPRLEDTTRRPFVLGLCGAQGSGKSFAAAALKQRLEASGVRAAILSLDDLYLSPENRAELARSAHPLLRTRGVPGTHDVALGETVIKALGQGGELLLPRFDKANDAPAPQSHWESVTGPVDVILFEGWCVGARAQPDQQLEIPVNALERDHDATGTWRRWVNGQLGGAAYQRLFARIDMLVLLAASGFEVVAGWRKEQERALRRRLNEEGLDSGKTLSDDQVDHFVQHYQRLTESILAEMPGRADLVVRLDEQRRPLQVEGRGGIFREKDDAALEELSDGHERDSNAGRSWHA